jgi:hypothetical protein
MNGTEALAEQRDRAQQTFSTAAAMITRRKSLGILNKACSCPARSMISC